MGALPAASDKRHLQVGLDLFQSPDLSFYHDDGTRRRRKRCVVEGGRVAVEPRNFFLRPIDKERLDWEAQQSASSIVGKEVDYAKIFFLDRYVIEQLILGPCLTHKLRLIVI